MKLLYGVIGIHVGILFGQRQRTLTKQPKLLLSFLIVFGSLKLIQSQKTNVVLIFAIMYQFFDLLNEGLLLAIIRYLKFCASWQESL